MPFNQYSVKKFKSSVVFRLTIRPKDAYTFGYRNNAGGLTLDSVVHQATMCDLYMVVINGYLYLHCTNTNNLYNLVREGFGLCMLPQLDDILKRDKIFRCYRLPKRTTKGLLEDMENGY
jgi:hypothetical protein